MCLDEIFKMNIFEIKIISFFREKKSEIMFYYSWMIFYGRKIFGIEHLKWLKQTSILTIFKNEND